MVPDLLAVAERGSRRPVERSDGHLAARLLLVRHRAQHGRAYLALRQVGGATQRKKRVKETNNLARFGVYFHSAKVFQQINY